jgi:hypothetical protein
MSDNIPLHLRITGLTPSNEDVDAFRAAVASLAAGWGKIRDAENIMKKAAAIAESLGGNGTPSNEFGKEIQLAVQKHASAFLYAEQPLQVGVCAGMAAMSIMKTEPGQHGWTVVNLYTNALWLSLSFQPPLNDEKRENLRREVLDRAQRRSVESAETAREREDVADSVELIVTLAEEDKITTNFKKIATSTIDVLRRNAALDREELDFLWWSQLSRSRLLNRPLAQIANSTRFVTLGIEAATHLRRLPAEVHRDIVLRTLDPDPEIDLVEVLAQLGDDRIVLANSIEVQTVSANPTVFPLLNAIVSGRTDCIGANEKRKLSTWGARSLLESALSKMMTVGILSK